MACAYSSNSGALPPAVAAWYSAARLRRGRLAHEFCNVAFLANGSFGLVYAAERVADGRQVALKLQGFNPTDCAQDEDGIGSREVQALRRLHANGASPHVVECLDIMVADTEAGAIRQVHERFHAWDSGVFSGLRVRARGL